jgi:uncharacterized membrane protein YidH (DUF202 family)
MGFGFVVARFGLYLQEFQVAQHILSARSNGFSLWCGTALIAAGVTINIFAGWRHIRLVQELNRGETAHSHPVAQAVAIAFFLALVGLAMAIYLISIRSFTGAAQPATGVAAKHSRYRNVGSPSRGLAATRGKGVDDV